MSSDYIQLHMITILHFSATFLKSYKFSEACKGAHKTIRYEPTIMPYIQIFYPVEFNLESSTDESQHDEDGVYNHNLILSFKIKKSSLLIVLFTSLARTMRLLHPHSRIPLRTGRQLRSI